MFLVRDIMYCKPGQARPMVQKFLALSKLGPQVGFGPMRVMTDVSAERYWTVVSEMEVESLEKYAETTRKAMELKEFQDRRRTAGDLPDREGLVSLTGSRDRSPNTSFARARKRRLSANPRSATPPVGWHRRCA